ncbi:hypothetical protein SAMN04488112_1013 [Melghirimyces thermohalophilus]|uniref:Uncharacterized protein n=1 Tax=Melghirimyces thermohalophilus TaxID=1236220 RepID=A0A1G6HJU7_9BACL|nr:hypothetical protein SAMN04488112_1013 [Melghirimyces thermohalophilus]
MAYLFLPEASFNSINDTRCIPFEGIDMSQGTHPHRLLGLFLDDHIAFYMGAQHGLGQNSSVSSRL